MRKQRKPRRILSPIAIIARKSLVGEERAGLFSMHFDVQLSILQSGKCNDVPIGEMDSYANQLYRQIMLINAVGRIIKAKELQYVAEKAMEAYTSALKRREHESSDPSANVMCFPEEISNIQHGANMLAHVLPSLQIGQWADACKMVELTEFSLYQENQGEGRARSA